MVDKNTFCNDRVNEEFFSEEFINYLYSQLPLADVDVPSTLLDRTPQQFRDVDNEIIAAKDVAEKLISTANRMLSFATDKRDTAKLEYDLVFNDCLVNNEEVVVLKTGKLKEAAANNFCREIKEKIILWSSRTLEAEQLYKAAYSKIQRLKASEIMVAREWKMFESQSGYGTGSSKKANFTTRFPKKKDIGFPIPEISEVEVPFEDAGNPGFDILKGEDEN